MKHARRLPLLLGLLLLLSARAAGAACSQNSTTLCLNNSRFQVRVTWTTSDGRNGSGQAVPLTSDTGYFWFFSSNNVEMVIKVVDGTGFNGKYWVFAAGLTNVNVVITVTDTQTGAVKTYVNPQGVAFAPIQDTAAFAMAPGESATSSGEEPASDASPPTALDAGEAVCTPDAATLCVNGGRYQVRVTWTTSDGRNGAGQAVSLTSDTGYFWFFSSNNVEMIVKVVTGCAVNSRIWVFAGGLTNVNVVMTVTDTVTGAVKTYTNSQGTAFLPIQDTNAFASCVTAADFAGNWTGQWVNNTFSSSGPASLVVTVDTAAQTFQATLTLGGNVFGAGPPPPQVFSGSYGSGGTFSQSSSLFGNLTLTVSSGGAITGSATNIPNPNIARLDFTGTATPQKIVINSTATFSAAAGGGTANEVLTLNHIN